MVRKLQELCEVGVAVDICNDFEMKNIIFSILDHQDCLEGNIKVERWNSDILKAVLHFAEHFPSHLLGRIQYYVPLIALEMVKWSHFHKELFCLTLDFSKEFINSSIFKFNGVIDQEKAARALLEETSLRISTRFEIACYYSFPDMIMKFWVQLHDFEINTFSLDMVRCWTDYMSGKGIKFDGEQNFTFYSLMTAVECSSEVSFHYFWKKLKVDEKEGAAIKFMKTFFEKARTWKSKENCVKLQYLYEPYINMLQIIVKELGRKKVIQLVDESENTYEMLKYMLNWPYQSSFFEISKCVWKELPIPLFYSLLREIVVKIDDILVTNVYDYRLLLRNFWNASPNSFKKFIIHKEPLQRFDSSEEIYPDFLLEEGFEFFVEKSSDCLLEEAFEFLLRLFEIDFTEEDEKNLSLILENVTTEELKSILETNGADLLIKSVKKGNYKYADWFLKCCKVKDLKEFKRNLIISPKFVSVLKYYFSKLDYYSFDNIVKWILGTKEFVIFKENLFILISRNLYFNSLSFSVSISSDDNKMEKDLVLDVKYIVQKLLHLLDKERNYEVDEFAEWVCVLKENVNKCKVGVYKSYSRVLSARRGQSLF